MEQVRMVVEQVVEKVKAAWNGEHQTPVETLLDEHLSLNDDKWMILGRKPLSSAGIPTFVLNELASRTHNVVDCPYIDTRIWNVLVYHQMKPTLMKKALSLLHYLLRNGSLQVMKSTKTATRVSFLNQLAAEYNKDEYERYEFSQTLDIGAGVRQLASDISLWLANDDLFVQSRQEAAKVNQSLCLRGLRSVYPSSSGSEYGELRPCTYTDVPINDDIGAKIVTHLPHDG